MGIVVKRLVVSMRAVSKVLREIGGFFAREMHSYSLIKYKTASMDSSSFNL